MQNIDVLFIAYYHDRDRYYNHSSLEPLHDYRPVNIGPMVPLASPKSDMLDKLCVKIDHGRYDFARLLSLARFGTPANYRSFDAHTPNHLVGSYFYSLFTQAGFSISSINNCDRLDLETLEKHYLPKHVLVSTSLIAEDFVISDVCNRVRKLWPEASLVLGGLLLVELERALNHSEFVRVLENWDADAYICTPRGEESALRIVASDKKSILKAQPPLTWVRGKNGYVKTESKEKPEVSIDNNRVRWNLFPADSLYHCIHLRTARSCRFRCKFCSYRANQGKLVLGSINDLEQQLSELVNYSHVKSLVFIDDTFNWPPKRFQAICRLLTRFDFEWYSHFRVQDCDADTAKLMEDSGCRGVFLGIESVDDTVLSNMNKRTTVAEYVRGLRNLTATRIFTHASILIGFPGDVADNIHKTATFLDDQGIDSFAATPWHFSPATPISRRRKEFQLRGRFADWNHTTMDSAMARSLCDQLRDLPQKCVYADELAADGFWSSLMLLCNGVSREDVCDVWRSYSALMGNRFVRKEIENSIAYKKLVSIMRKGNKSG
jgi:p-methyltransferase